MKYEQDQATGIYTDVERRADGLVWLTWRNPDGTLRGDIEQIGMYKLSGKTMRMAHHYLKSIAKKVTEFLNRNKGVGYPDPICQDCGTRETWIETIGDWDYYWCPVCHCSDHWQVPGVTDVNIDALSAEHPLEEQYDPETVADIKAGCIV